MSIAIAANQAWLRALKDSKVASSFVADGKPSRIDSLSRKPDIPVFPLVTDSGVKQSIEQV